MKIKIKRFNEAGNIEFNKFVKESKKKFKKNGQKKFSPAIQLIQDKKLCEDIDGVLEIDTTKTFFNAFEYSKYISEKLNRIDIKKYRWDDGLFNWICASLFHNFFPGVRGGVDELRVFLSGTSKSKWRRNFARTFWEIYHEYKEIGLCLLYKETNNFSDELETVSKSPIMFSNKSIVEAYSDLFFKKTGSNKGEQKYKRGQVGDFRNFIDELLQLDINLDLYRMSKDQIINNLDKKFRKNLTDE